MFDMATELRQKKLASGKEKLAAFRSKKAKALKKLNTNSNAENDGDLRQQFLQDFNSAAKGSEETSPSDSELCSLTSDDEQFDETAILCSSKTHIPFTLSELENAMDEKHMIKDIIHYGESSQWIDMSKVESALSQRDELLSQLASSLEFFQKHPSQTDDFTTQLCALAQHICTLKSKLNQANEDLQEQLILHDSSMISLQAAKAQILQLQMIIIKKDEHINSLSHRLQMNSEALKIKDQSIEQCHLMLQAQSAELETYRREMESKLIEIQQWAAVNTTWELKEQELLASVCDKSEEILTLEQSLQVLKQEKSELHEKYVFLQTSSAENNSDARLQDLEQQLTELRSAHELDLQEISRLQNRNRDLEISCDDQLKSLSLYQSLQQDYEHMTTQHSSCLHQLEKLNTLNADLHHKIDLLVQAEQEHQVLKQHFEELKFNYDCEVGKSSELEAKLLDFENSPVNKTLFDFTMNRHTPPLEPCTVTNSGSDYQIKEVIEAGLHTASMLEDNVSSGELNSSFQQESVESVPPEMDNVLQVSKKECSVSFQQESADSVPLVKYSPNQELDSKKLQLFTVIEDLHLKLNNSEAVNQQYAEKLKLLENVTSSDLISCSTDSGVIRSSTEELEQLKTEINKLTLKIQTQEMELNKTKTELVASKESQLCVESEMNMVSHVNGQKSNIVANTVHESLQLVQQQLLEKETAQEELQTQLESTITQWQKLQLIVQEKEIDIQNLHENLDEQKRICGNMTKSHQEYVEVLQSEIEILRLRLEDYQEKFFTMENEILQLITEKNSIQTEDRKENQLSHLQMINIDTQTDLNSIEAEIHASFLDQKNLDIPSEAHLHLASTNVKVQTVSLYNEMGDNLEQQINAEEHSHGMHLDSNCQSTQLTLSEDCQVKNVTVVEELKQCILQKDTLIGSLQLSLADKEALIQELENKMHSIESELVTIQNDLKERLKSTEDNLALKDYETVNMSKKVTAQQLKLKASKKQISQKEKVISELTDKLNEIQNQMSDLNQQVTEKNNEISELLNKIIQKDKIIEDLQLKLGKRVESIESAEEINYEKSSIVLNHSNVVRDDISNLTETLFERDIEVARLNTVVIEREELLSKLNKELSEVNERCTDLLENVSVKDEQLSLAGRQLDEKEEQLRKIITQLAEKDDQLSTASRQLADKDDQLSTANRQLAEKDDQLSTASRQLAEKDDQLSTASRQLAEKDDQLSTASWQLAENDEIEKLHKNVTDKEQESQIIKIQNDASQEISHLKEWKDEEQALYNQLQDTDEEITILKSRISIKDQENCSLFESLQAKDSEVLRLTDEFKVKVEELSFVSKILSDRDEKILHLQKQLSEAKNQEASVALNMYSQNEEVGRLLDIIKQRDEQLENLHKTVDEKTDHISELMRTDRERDETIIKFQNKLADKEKELCHLLEISGKKDAIMAELNKSVIEKENEFRQISDQISSHQSIAQAKAAELAYLNEQLLEKEETIGNLLITVSGKNDLIIELNGKLVQKTEDLVHLQNAVSKEAENSSALTSSLCEKDMEISQLNVMIAEQLKEISNLNDKLIDSVLQYQSVLSEKNELEITVNHNLTAKINENTELLSNISEKDQQLIDLKNILSEQSAQILHLQEIVSEKESVIDKQSSEKETQIISLCSQITDKEVEISHLQTALDEKDSQMIEMLSAKDSDLSSMSRKLTLQWSELNRALLQKDEEMGDLLITLSGQQESLALLNSKLASSKDEISSLNSVIIERDAHITDLSHKLSDHVEEITKLNQNMSALSEELSQKDADISALQMNILDLNGQVANLESYRLHLQQELSESHGEMCKTKAITDQVYDQVDVLKTSLAEKDVEIVNLQTMLTERESELTRRNELMTARDVDITALLRTLSEKEDSLLNMTQILKEKEDKIVLMQGVLSDKTSEINFMQKSIDDKNSELVSLQKDVDCRNQENFKLLVAVNEKNESISALHSQLKIVSDVNNETTVTMSAKENEIMGFTAQISDLVENNAKLSEKLSVIETATVCQLADKDSIIDSIKGQLSLAEALQKETAEKLTDRDLESEMLKKTLQRKEADINAAHLKLSELDNTNKKLNDNIVSLNQELADCMLKLNSEETYLTETAQRILEKEEIISQMQGERDNIREQIVSQDICINELKDTVTFLQSEISQQKQQHCDRVIVMKEEHAGLLAEVDKLTRALYKKDQDEQDSRRMKSQLIDLETEIERLKKELEDSDSEKKLLEVSNNDLLLFKDNLLLRLDDMEQKRKEKDFEISEITSRLIQEQESCKHLTNSNFKLQKSHTHLQSCLSYVMETAEESQSMLIQQMITAQEQKGNLLSLSYLQNDASHTNQDVPDGNRSSENVGESHSKPLSEINYQRLVNQLLVLTEDCQNKEGLLLEQKVEMDSYSSLVKDLSAKLEETNLTMSEVVHSNTSLREEVDAVKAQCHTLTEGELVLKQRISLLEGEVESQGLISSHHVAECNRLADSMSQLSQELDAKEKLLLTATFQTESYLKEMNDLKAELELKVTIERSLKDAVDFLTSSLEKSQEERELLKANFDSCMEDMQQKHAQQELGIQNLRSQLAEQTKTVYQGQDQLKDMFELQICQLEEKLLLSEKQGEQLAKELADSKAKYSSCKDLFEGQMSDLDISLQAANSETAKLRDQLSKIMHNHECDIAGLKRLHEIQTSELEDSCLSLERNVSELKRQINEQAAKFKKEKSSLEQSLDFHLSDFEEKRRLHETEISRLKRYLEEMKQDHEIELRNLEKSYEARMYELEDKCCISTNELERLRKFFSSDGEYSEERHRLDLRIDELETKRRDLEIQNMALEDEVKHLREQEEEFKSLLHSMAEKQDEKVTETAEEIISLKHNLSELTHEKNQADLSLQTKKADLERVMNRNEELELRIAELEKLVEQTITLGMKDKDEGERLSLSNLSDLQRQIDSLSEENRSLKRQLVMQEMPGRSLRLNSGVEAICPPYSHAPTEYIGSQNINTECFSPVLDNEVLEGFVAEKYNSDRRDSECNMNNNSRVNQEPDFVVEENDRFQEPDFVVEQTDRFQPEIDNERLMDGGSQLDMHPIWENEGFQPEKSDLFFMEEPEQRMDWPNELSVGLSPSQHQIGEHRFDFSNSGEHGPSSHAQKTEEKNLGGEEEASLASEKTCEQGVNERQINQMKEDLEEQYVMKMRKQESDLLFKYESQCDQYKKEMEQHFAQKVQAVRYEWERKFTKALRKLKKDMEKRSIPEQGQDHRSRTSDSTDSSRYGRMNSVPADIAGRNEELGEVVEKLHKENQELAEVRDDLLRQIEISRARGLHDRVQHELQTMLTTRDTHSLPCAPPQATIPPAVDNEESATPANQSIDEGDGSKSEASDSSSVRECFLEELEEISHQSGQDLPLEWELTSTEAGAFEQEPASIWEVFDGRCVRQDCQEVRIRFHKLYQWVVKHQGVGCDNLLFELNYLLGNALDAEASKNESVDYPFNKAADQSHSISASDVALKTTGSSVCKVQGDLYQKFNGSSDVSIPIVRKSIYEEIMELDMTKMEHDSDSYTAKHEIAILKGCGPNVESEPVCTYSRRSSVQDDSELLTNNELLDKSFSNNSDKIVEDSPITLQDQKLAEELNHLRKDLVDTKAIYCKENVLLQKALIKNQEDKAKMMSQKASDKNSEMFGHQTREVIPDSSGEHEITKQKLAICMEQICMLEDENTSLHSRLRKQEALTVHLKYQLHQKDQDIIEWQKSFGSHLTALQKQRSDLLQLLENKQSGKEPFISVGLQEVHMSNSVQQQVREDLLGKIEELDHLYKMLTLRQIELQHCEAERRHLEQMCLLKDFTEIQLKKQKRLMEEHISEIELRLYDREAALREDKNRLLQELNEHDIKLSDMTCVHTPLNSQPSTNMTGENISNFSSSQHARPDENETSRQHIKAIEVLRAKLWKEYEIQAAKLEKVKWENLKS